MRVKAIALALFAFVMLSYNGLAPLCFAQVSTPWVVAHRGGAGEHPENTLEAFISAISSGAMAIETDVRSTRDGIQVMSHDDALIVDGVEYPLDSWDYADLKTLQSDLCTLEEALSVIAASDLYLLLELKSGSNVPLCIDAVKVCGMQDRTTLVSFRKKKLKKAREYDPNIALGLIVGEMPSDVGDTVASLNLSMVCQEYHHLTKDALAAWHDMGLHVNTWTVDSEAQLSRYMKWGVDSITTNYPKLAVSAVEP